MVGYDVYYTLGPDTEAGNSQDIQAYARGEGGGGGAVKPRAESSEPGKGFPWWLLLLAVLVSSQ